MALGHPVIGDRLYCAEGAVDTERMMLHAERLEFLHPVHHARMRLVAACEF
jgi:23S rRNA-/tRNA-specific pseudouridylate synthase